MTVGLDRAAVENDLCSGRLGCPAVGCGDALGPWGSAREPAQQADLATRTGLTITVCHFPPGTSKWNTIEHRLFSHISMNWRARPLTGHEVWNALKVPDTGPIRV